MKSILGAILMGGAVLLLISSCATVPKGPLGEGELRLLSMEVPENGNFRTGIQYWVTINFEADGIPEIKRVCFYWSGDGPYCANVNVKGVTHTLSHANFQVPLAAPLGSNRVECYVEYIRDGKRLRTNTVDSFITGISR
jgi:hypothetical protein